MTELTPTIIDYKATSSPSPQDGPPAIITTFAPTTQTNAYCLPIATLGVDRVAANSDRPCAIGMVLEVGESCFVMCTIGDSPTVGTFDCFRAGEHPSSMLSCVDQRCNAIGEYIEDRFGPGTVWKLKRAARIAIY